MKKKVFRERQNEEVKSDFVNVVISKAVEQKLEKEIVDREKIKELVVKEEPKKRGRKKSVK